MASDDLFLPCPDCGGRCWIETPGGTATDRRYTACPRCLGAKLVPAGLTLGEHGRACAERDRLRDRVAELERLSVALADIDYVRQVYPNAVVYAGREGRFVAVREWPEKGGRLSPVGCWCNTVAAAWRSAARRLREGLPGPGGPGVRA